MLSGGRQAKSLPLDYSLQELPVGDLRAVFDVSRLQSFHGAIQLCSDALFRTFCRRYFFAHHFQAAAASVQVSAVVYKRNLNVSDGKIHMSRGLKDH